MISKKNKSVSFDVVQIYKLIINVLLIRTV